DRFHVEIEQEVPVLLGTVEHAAVVDVSGAVHEHIEGAELGSNLIGKRLDGCGRAHIELATLESFEPLQFFVVHIGGDHTSALRRENLCNGAADSLSRGSDERKLVLQT